MRKDEAEDLLSLIKSSFAYDPLPQEDIPHIKTLVLPPGRTVLRQQVFGADDTSIVVHNHYQIGPADLQRYVSFILVVIGLVILLTEYSIGD